MFTREKARILLAVAVSIGVSFAGDTVRAAPESVYADPNTCTACHSDVAARYSKTGMARTFGTVRGGAGDGHLADVVYSHAASAETLSLSHLNTGFQLERHQIGFTGSITNSLAARIDYWFGSGDHARSYFSRTSRNELMELPLTWYSEKDGYWAMSPGYDSPSHAGFSRKATYRCMFCHNAYPALKPGADRMDTGTAFPVDLPQGIDCQRCHGPGLDHVQAVIAGRPAADLKQRIVNPSTLPLPRRDEVCLQCHLEPTSLALPAALPVYGRGVFSYRPGEPLEGYMRYFDHAPGAGYDDKFEFAGAPYRLRKSRCFIASQGALTCITCHDPHEPDQAQIVARSNTACVSCHSTVIAHDSNHASTANCVSCHMQSRRPSDAIHVTITDHDIQSRPQPVGDPLTEVNSQNQPPYRGEVTPYYPRADDLYTAIAQVRNQANLDAGILHLQQIVVATRPEYPEVWTELGDARRHSGESAAALQDYQEAIARDPGYWPAWHGMGLARAAAGDLQGALDSLNRAIKESNGDELAFRSLASILTEMGRAADAIAALRAGLIANSDSAELHNDLGTALLRAGDAHGAESSLREAVRLRPESSAMHLNLANLLIRSDRFEEARFEFQAAIRIDPSSAQAHSGYGTALASRRMFSAALDEFHAALKINPALPNIHNNLGAVLKELGDNEGAAAEYRDAISIDPAFATARYNLAMILELQKRLPEAIQQLEDAVQATPGYDAAHLRLGELLLQAHRPVEAMPHLRRAAQSSDASLAGEARAAMKNAK
ncbi:MAG TPA: tetratricopeptide repeat protein [Bryobacteraceae bacterium]|nr:tetratricopeptide repeat protein [Bryobacteraceae bacterium]